MQILNSETMESGRISGINSEICRQMEPGGFSSSLNKSLTCRKPIRDPFLVFWTNSLANCRIRSRRTGESSNQTGSSTKLFNKKWLVWTTIRLESSLITKVPRGETSAPRLTDESAISICALVAQPKSSICCMAVSTEGDSRTNRRRMWIGGLDEIIGLALIAFKQTPTERELNPIFPMIPAWTKIQNFSDGSTRESQCFLTNLCHHPYLGFTTPFNGHQYNIIFYLWIPIPILR